MGDYWQRTIDMYRDVISKPKLTEKLLTRPPFRFMHDVIMSVMTATGYPQGVFSEAECDSANVSEKDSKIAFLEKIIRHVEATIGEEVTCKPSKIVAGQEPEATNIFLQGLARAATGQFQKREEPPKEERKKKTAADKKPAAPPAEERKAEEPRKQQAEDTKAKEEADAKRKKEERRLAEEKKKKEAEEEKRQAEQRALEEAKAREEAKAKEEAKRKTGAGKEAGRKGREEEKKAAKPAAQPAPQEDEPVRVAKPERPTTAGRRPPKVDDKVVVEDQKRPADTKAPANIITEAKGRGKVVEEDDDEIVKPTQKKPGMGVKAGDVKQEEHGKLVREILNQEQAAKDQGRDDQPDESGLSAPEGKKIKITRGIRAKTETKPKPVQISIEDMETLKTSIQSLCQSTNPLGKSMDFITDDIDSMQREYEKWKLVHKQASTQVEEQRKVTEDSLQQLYDRLAEIEEQVKEKQIKINHKKASILKNEMQIKSLLQAVVSTK